MRVELNRGRLAGSLRSLKGRHLTALTAGYFLVVSFLMALSGS